jgi:hypothetical protein
MADTQGGGGSVAAYQGITGLLKPEHYPKLLRRYGNNFGQNSGMGSLFMMSEMIGASRNISRDDLYWWEEGWIINSGQVQAVAGAGGPGTSIAVTLTAASHGPNGQADFRVNDTVYFSSIGATTFYPYGFITAITPTANANVLTIYPYTAAMDISAGGANQVSANDTLFIATNAYAEGTTGRTSLTTPPIRKQTHWQIVKDTYSATGSSMGVENWPDMGEGAGNFQYAYDEKNTFMRHTCSIDLALLIGNRITNPAITATSGSTFDGLVPMIRQNGLNPTYGGVVNIPFFDQFNNLLDRQGSPVLYHGWVGNIFEQQLENMVTSDFKNGAVDYYSFKENITRDMAAELNLCFKSFTKSGRQFTWMKYGMFSHPQLAGTTGFRFNESAIFMPQANFTDRKTNEVQPAFTIYYKQMKDGRARKGMTVKTGMMAPTPTSALDAQQTDMLTELAPQFPIINQYAFVAPW